jgi:suppressor for copper-sensitivity B
MRIHELRSLAIRSIAAFVAIFLAIISPAAFGQVRGLPGFGLEGFGASAADNGKVTLSAQILPAATGRPTTLVITADIIPGWHIYSITQKKGGPLGTVIELDPATDYRLAGKFQTSPQPKVHQETFWPGLDLEEHDGQVTWSVPIDVTAGTKLADLVVRGIVKSQACSNVCVDLKLPFEARLSADQSAVPPEAQPSSPPKAAPVAAPSGAPEFRSPSVVVTGQLDQTEISPGGQFNLQITITPAAGWHIYEQLGQLPTDQFTSRPTLIVLDSSSGFTPGPPVSSQPVIETPSKNGSKPQRYYSGPVSFTMPVSAPRQAGNFLLDGVIGYQACSEAGTCTMPTATRFQASIPVGMAARPGSTALAFTEFSYTQLGDMVGTATEASASAGAEAVAKFTWLASTKTLLIAFVAGLILNVMPCVLPVIGLKVMSFVQQAGEDRGRIFQLNVWYALGIMSVFMVLAALAAFANIGWGQQFQTPEVGITLAAVVFVFALSLLGVWEIPIPGFVGSGAAVEYAEREGVTAAYSKGILTTILATPCGGPFLGPAVAWAMAQPKAVIFATFASMGLGMASPYLILGLSPGLIRFLPKPGAWMETFKELMGFVLLGTVVWIFTWVREEYRVATLALLFGLWLACWLFGRVPITAGGGSRLKAALLGGVFAALVGWFSFQWLVPGNEWEPYTPGTLTELRERGTTVLIDFTANT